MSSADGLAIWMRAQLDEDEQRTRRLLRYAQENALAVKDPKLLGSVIPGWHEWPDVEAMCSTRLAELKVMRQLLDCIVGATNRGTSRLVAYDEPWAMGGDYLVKILAQPYADRVGYREEWRP